ncbi:hypothetical protein FRX31_033302 [Thalictrum thalictroides]|uniref:Uncharacterized protein n=1 Tax=Thalictrum thalictroides TaxID=46969 RepID=A0A7J6UXA3_THATH|nr:hypothetical protein FRX31_033302 [Thalictrum thalictroides]
MHSTSVACLARVHGNPGLKTLNPLQFGCNNEYMGTASCGSCTKWRRLIENNILYLPMASNVKCIKMTEYRIVVGMGRSRI